MPGIGKIEVKYKDGGGSRHTFRKYIGSVGSAGEFLAGDGSTIDLAAATVTGQIENAGTAIQAFLKSYEFVASTNSIVESVEADWREDGGPGVVDSTATYVITGFAPAAGASGYGPYPAGFVSAKGKSAVSN